MMMIQPGTNFTQFSEQKVAARDPVIELKTGNGLSNLRDRVETTGSGTVTGTVGSPEFVLATTASGTDAAILESAEIGRYVPGFTAEMGVGVRVPADLVGNQIARWGYFDANNGFGYGLDVDGLFIFIRRTGTDEILRPADWNGENKSVQPRLDRGNIFQISFAWYGYGSVRFNWVSARGLVNLHSFTPNGETSIADPNQPIRAEISNSGTATAQALYIAGRQFSVYGQYAPNVRVNAERRFELGSIGDTLLPCVSMRRKTAYNSTSLKVEGVEIVSPDNIYYELRTGATLTGASWGNPSNTDATETALEADVTATAGSGGDFLYSGMIPGGSGKSANVGGANGLNFDFVRGGPVTLFLRKFPSGTTASASAVLRIREEW